MIGRYFFATIPNLNYNVDALKQANIGENVGDNVGDNVGEKSLNKSSLFNTK